MTHVFIYGTLKRGGTNHRVLAGQRFIAPARTAPTYKLYSLGDYPGMIAAPAGGRSIEGELWEVDDPTLKRLDAFEGTDQGLYARVPVALLPPHDTLAVEGYLYLHSVAGHRELGDRWPI